jgi:hypothetical protein
MGQSRSFGDVGSMSDLPKSGRSKAIFAGGSLGLRPGRCRAVVRLSRDPTRRTSPHNDGPHDGDGGRVSARVMRLSIPLPDLVGRCRQRRKSPSTGLGLYS